MLDDFVKKGTFETFSIRSYDAEGKFANEAMFREKQVASPEIPFVSRYL